MKANLYGSRAARLASLFLALFMLVGSLAYAAGLTYTNATTGKEIDVTTSKPLPTSLNRTYSTTTLTIASGGTTSTATNSSTAALFGLQLPAAFTGTTLTFEVSADNGATYQALYDRNNTQVSVPVTQGRSYSLPEELAAFTHFKIVSGSAEGAARSLVLVGKG